LRIVAVLADPVGLDADSEAVWLTNEGISTVYLEGWHLEDESTRWWSLGTKPGEDSVQPWDTLRVDRAGHGSEAMWINNNGDRIALYNSDFCFVDSVRFGPQGTGDTAWFAGPRPNGVPVPRNRE